MSSPGSPRSSTVLDPTRQQLDELDALLESMLALPVNRLDNELDVPAPVAASQMAASRSPMSAPESKPARPASPPVRSLSHEPEARPPASPKQRSMLQSRTEGPHNHKPEPSAIELSTETEKVPAPESRPAHNGRKKGKNPHRDEPNPAADAPTPPRPTPSIFGKPASSPVSGRNPPPALWLYPLIWINGLFDLCSRLLGNPGRWLRRPRGRTFLGWTGLLLLTAALVLLILDQIGWTW